MKMKKYLLTIFLVLLVSHPSYSADFIVGVKSGLYIWEPYIKDIDASGFNQIDKGTGVLYGPVFSALFTEDLSVSLALLTGKQSAYWSPWYDSWEGQYLAGTYYFESKRVDMDAAVSYRVMPNLKVFGGYKLQYIKSVLNYTELRTDSGGNINELGLTNTELDTPSQGPAIGLGVSYPFGKGFFTAANVSGLYMRGEFKLKGNRSVSYSSFTTTNTSTKFDFSLDTTLLGLNLEPSVGFRAENGLMFTLGVRFQWLKTSYEDNFPGETKPLPDASDFLYGVFISILYNI